jgi:hypothetical protein
MLATDWVKTLLRSCSRSAVVWPHAALADDHHHLGDGGVLGERKHIDRLDALGEGVGEGLLHGDLGEAAADAGVDGQRREGHGDGLSVGDVDEESAARGLLGGGRLGVGAGSGAQDQGEGDEEARSAWGAVGSVAVHWQSPGE